MMLRVVLVVSVVSLSAVVIASGIAQTKPSDDAASALNAVAKTKVAWNFAKAKVADVTCDGKPDRVLFGVSKGKVWMGMLPGGGGKPQTAAFPLHASGQDSFCGVPAGIGIYSLNCNPDATGKLDGCKPIRGCKEFAIDGGECDNFHFYWNSRDRRLDYWRL